MNEQINPVAQVQPLPTTSVATPVAPTVKYVGFWARYTALVIDTFLITIINYVLVFSLLGKDFFTPPANPEALLDLQSKIPMLIAVNIASLAIYILYFVLMTYYKGATVGKMAIGATVQSENGARLSIGYVFLREVLGRIVSQFTFGIGYLMAAFTSKKQALHDKIASSVVVFNNPAEKNRWPTALGVVLFFLPMVLIVLIFSGVALASLNSARLQSEAARGSFNQATQEVR